MYLYTLTNRVNGLVYVGATTLSLPRRMGCHRQDSEDRTTALSQAIRKFGWEAFELKVLMIIDTFDELMFREREAIASLGTLVPNGYNMASGGPGVPDLHPSEETRAKMRAYRVGKTPWNKGCQTGQLSNEHRAKLSNAGRGRTAWNKGIPFTPEHRAKLVGKRVGAANGNARAIEYLGKQYGSIADAERALGLSKMQMKYKLRKGEAVYIDTPTGA